MEGYWPTIPLKLPPNDNIRPYGVGSYKRNYKSYKRSEHQQDEISHQRILMKKITLCIHFMCKKL